MNAVDDCDAVAAVFVAVDELLVFNEASSFNGDDIIGVANDNDEVGDCDGDDDVDDDVDDDDDDDDGDDSDETITFIRSTVFINSPFKIQT